MSSAAVIKNTGRWTEEEHEKFIAAFEIFGGNWKMISKRIGTRSNIQCRTHGQKIASMLKAAKAQQQQQDNKAPSPTLMLRKPKLSHLRVSPLTLSNSSNLLGSSSSNNMMFLPLPPPWLATPVTPQYQMLPRQEGMMSPMFFAAPLQSQPQTYSSPTNTISSLLQASTTFM